MWRKMLCFLGLHHYLHLRRLCIVDADGQHMEIQVYEQCGYCHHCRSRRI